MKRRHSASRRCLVTLILLGVASPSVTMKASAEDAPLTAEQIKFFESKIRPVLVKECYSCHSSKTGNAKGGLRLDTEQLGHVGGSSGPAVVPFDLDASLLYNAITYQDFAMPPNRPLAKEVVEDFRQWIEMGAPDPRKTEVTTLNSSITAEDIAQAKSDFWAYQPPTPQPTPAVKDEAWPRGEADRFVLAALDEANLTPASDAEPHQVLRRLCYDLIGLPPSFEQTETFTKLWGENPDEAVADMIDDLLASPQFGERWGRHWLDLARYAESNGREVNMTMPHAWRYRDYVIDSFNEDKPYDRFILEQLAGDLLPAKDDQEWAKNLVATSFLALGPKSLSEQNGVQFAADLVDEQIDTTTRVMLGTSVACARCHDHKFDPIPQSDYYALAGIFASTSTFFGAPASEFGNVGGIQNRNKSNLIRLPIDDPNPYDREYTSEELAQMTDQMVEARRELVELRMAQRSGRSDGQNAQMAIVNLVRLQTRMETLSSLLGSVDENGKPISFCMGVQDKDEPRDVRVLGRGEIDQPGQVVRRDVPQVLRHGSLEIDSKSSGRLELAHWIANPDNPLTARVMVNRIWQHLVGTGIVATTEDFGTTGQAPTHPELLDHLAVKFVESGWSTKEMIRLIASSRTYRMSSQHDAAKFNQDPDNKLLWRANPRRMNAEAIRDSILFAAGRLDLNRPRGSEVAKAGYMQVRDGNLINIGKLTAMAGDEEARREVARQFMQQAANERLAPAMGDRPGRPMFDRLRGAMRGPGMGMGGPFQGPFAGAGDRVDMVNATYRSVYLPILRDELPRVLEVFDFAEPSMVIGQRDTSNTPNQALFMLNNDFVIQQSDAIARRIAEYSTKPIERLNRAFQLTYGRSPSKSEQQAVVSFVQSFSADGANRDRGAQALSALCQSLIASAEFRYID